ncbi:helicase [Cutibacterium acnes JCM 18916]|nr:helicase [Cutibacterium acnes JCM 18916]
MDAELSDQITELRSQMKAHPATPALIASPMRVSLNVP